MQTTPYPFIYNPNDTTRNLAYIGFYSENFISKLKPIHYVKLESITKWNKLLLYVEPSIINQYYGRRVLGSKYTRAGITPRVNSSFIRYHSDPWSIQLGRSPVWWGQSWQNSIVHSREAINYDHISSRVSIGNYQLEMLVGQLNSEFYHVSSTDSVRIKRFLSGHRLIWSPSGNRLILTVGELIVYTGQNRGLELFYQNPAIPYFFTALEGNEEENPDNDNSIIFFDGRYNIRSNFSLYFELIVDEYQIDENNVPDAIGFKLGIDGGMLIFDNYNLLYIFEINQIGSWTYIHRGQFTSIQNLGHPIGYKYGPDNRSLEIIIDYWLDKNYKSNITYTYLEKGNNNLYTYWDAPGTAGNAFPSQPINYYNLFSISINHFWKFGSLEIGYSNYPVTNAEIDGVINAPDGSLFVRAQLTWGFGYSLVTSDE